MELVIDNSNKYFDPLLEEYVDNEPDEFPYNLNDENSEAIAMFKTLKDAMVYQMDMGLRGSTTIELWEE